MATPSKRAVAKSATKRAAVKRAVSSGNDDKPKRLRTSTKGCSTDGKITVRPTQVKLPKVREPGKAGRPRKEIDLGIVERLAKIQCTVAEVAAVLGVNVETLCRSTEFVETYNTAKEGGKMSLRRKQHQVAIKDGNVPMLIFLGKQYLGQKDVAANELSGPDKGPIPVAAMMAAVETNLTRDEQNQLILLMKKAKVAQDAPKQLG